MKDKFYESIEYEEICNRVYETLLSEEDIDDINVRRIISWQKGNRKQIRFSSTYGFRRTHF